MKYVISMVVILSVATVWITGCSKSNDKQPVATTGQGATAGSESAVHTHGAGPNGGVLFDLGSHHAEFTVDHDKQQVTVLMIGDDEKTPIAVGAAEFVLNIKETKTADGKMVAPMTIALEPVDASGGKAMTFVGTDPGIGNVADFAGTVSGEIDGKPAMGEFDEAGGGSHGHEHTPHDGVIAALSDGSGFVELKLHDDKGDLELWLAKDREITQPLDIPAGSNITVSFKDLGKTATLAVRNNQQNEDEDGKANMRGAVTNYFIFPGDSGQDPTWLMGQDFKSNVTVSFTANGKNYTSEEFTLVPHTHADGHAH